MSLPASPNDCQGYHSLRCPGAAAVRPNLRLTPEQFALLCAQNREAVLVYYPGDLRAKSLELLQD